MRNQRRSSPAELTRVSFSALPPWVAAMGWALVTALGLLFGGMLPRSLAFSCVRGGESVLRCHLAQRVGFEDRDVDLGLGPRSTMRVLPVMTSSDTPNTVALQIFPLDGSVFQSVPLEDRASFDAVLQRLQACQASAAPRCSFGVEQRATIGAWITGLGVLAGLLTGLAFLVRTRVAVEGGRLLVQQTLLGMPLRTRLDVAREDFRGLELERDDSGEGTVGRILLHLDPRREGGRFLLLSTWFSRAEGTMPELHRLL
jgi:hypothetical protein